MRSALFAALLVIGGCGQSEPHEYPAQARARFHAACPVDDPVCTCTWDGITRAVTYEEYEAAMSRFESDGLMDPRVSRVNTRCRERHAGS